MFKRIRSLKIHSAVRGGQRVHAPSHEVRTELSEGLKPEDPEVLIGHYHRNPWVVY